MNRQVDGFARRLHGQAVFAGMADEQRVHLVNAHAHQLIFRHRRETDVLHAADVFRRDLVDPELDQLIDAHPAEAERLQLIDLLGRDLVDAHLHQVLGGTFL